MNNLEKQQSAEHKPETQLVKYLESVDTDQLLSSETSMVKGLITQISNGLDLATAHASPKLFNVRAKLGKGAVIKLLCAVLKSFCDSIKASRTMDAIDIVECAELLEEKYSHDSLKDIILALKYAKLKGMTFYNSIDSSVIMLICSEYFEKKSAWLEAQHKEYKSKFGDFRDETDTVQKAMDEALKKKQQQQQEYIAKMKLEKELDKQIKINQVIQQELELKQKSA